MSFGALVIPNSEKQVIVPWYKDGRDGFTFGTTAHVLWGWAICKQDKLYFNKVDYYNGVKPNYNFVSSIRANDGKLQISSYFSQALDAFRIEKLSDFENIIANEMRNYCQ